MKKLIFCILLLTSCYKKKLKSIDQNINKINGRLRTIDNIIDLMEIQFEVRRDNFLRYYIMPTNTICYVWQETDIYKNIHIRHYSHSIKGKGHYFYNRFMVEIWLWKNYEIIANYKLIKK